MMALIFVEKAFIVFSYTCFYYIIFQKTKTIEIKCVKSYKNVFKKHIYNNNNNHGKII